MCNPKVIDAADYIRDYNQFIAATQATQ